MYFNTIDATFATGLRCSHSVAGMINAQLCPPETRRRLSLGSYHLPGLRQSHFVSRIRRTWRATFPGIVSSSGLAARWLSKNVCRAFRSLCGLTRSVVAACSVSLRAWLRHLWTQSLQLTEEDLDEVLQLILDLEHDVKESEAGRLELRAKYIEDWPSYPAAEETLEAERQVTITHVEMRSVVLGFGETLENVASGTSLADDPAELDDVLQAILDLERDIKEAESVRVELNAKYVEGRQRHAALEAALDDERQVAKPSAGYEDTLVLAETEQRRCCNKISKLAADEAMDLREMDAGERTMDLDVVHSRVQHAEDLGWYRKELGEMKALMLEWDTAVDGWDDDERTLVDISNPLAHLVQATSSKSGSGGSILDVQHSVVASPGDLLDDYWMSGDEPSFDLNDIRCSTPFLRSGLWPSETQSSTLSPRSEPESKESLGGIVSSLLPDLPSIHIEHDSRRRWQDSPVQSMLRRRWRNLVYV